MTGLIPQTFIDEILQRTDVVELIDGFVPLKKKGRNHMACCPFHNEKTPSFSVNAKKQYYHCFGCGESGNAVSFVMKYFNKGFVEAIEDLAKRLGMEIPRNKQGQQHYQKGLDYYQILEKVAVLYQQQLKQSPTAIDYLIKRGVDGHTAKRFRLGYAPKAWDHVKNRFPNQGANLLETGVLVENDNKRQYDRYRDRVMFPIQDRRGRVIGFGGRVLTADQQPKYLNSPETPVFHKSKQLYGLYQVIEQYREAVDDIIVVEGYMDVVALAQSGIDNAVASLGTAISVDQFQLLSAHTTHVICCFDGDDAGREAAWRALQCALMVVDDHFSVSFSFLPDGEDPDSLVRSEGKAAFMARLEKAQSLTDYLFAKLMQSCDLSSLAGRSLFINKIEPYYKRLKASAFRQLFLESLCRLVRMDMTRLAELLDQESMPTTTKTGGGEAPSSMRLAITLLLQNPFILKQLANYPDVTMLEGKGSTILRKLIEIIASQPEVTTAQLIEHWRDSPEFAVISKLASWRHHVPEEGIAAEFQGALQRIARTAMEQKIAKILHKAHTHGLTDDERLKLQETIAKMKAKDAKS